MLMLVAKLLLLAPVAQAAWPTFTPCINFDLGDAQVTPWNCDGWNITDAVGPFEHAIQTAMGAPSAVLMSLAGASLDFGCGIVQIVWNTWIGAFAASIEWVGQNFWPVIGSCAGIAGALLALGIVYGGGHPAAALAVLVAAPVVAFIILGILIVIWFLLLAVSFAVVFILAVIVAVIAVPIPVIVALLLLFVTFFVIAGLVLLVFTAAWLIYLGVLLTLTLVGLGAVDGSLRASKKSSGSCGKCAGQGIVSKWVVPGLVYLIGALVANVLLLWDLGVLFVMWSSFHELSGIQLPITQESMKKLLEASGINLTGFFNAIASIYSIFYHMQQTIQDFTNFDCFYLLSMIAASQLLAGMLALNFFQSTDIKMALTHMLSHCFDQPGHKRATETLLDVCAKMIELMMVAGSPTFIRMFSSPFAGCDLYIDQISGIFGIVCLWLVGVPALLVAPDLMMSGLKRSEPRQVLAESPRRMASVMSVLIGRWGDWSLEACGLLEYRARKDGLGESQVQAYIEVSSTFISSAFQIIPCGKVLSELMNASNVGHVWIDSDEAIPVQKANGWSWATKILAWLKFCLLQPIPFLEEASTGQVTLLWICLSLTFVEELCSSMIADPQPPTDDYEDEKLNSAMAGVVSRGFHAGCRELQNIRSALERILISALQLAWQGIGIAASAAYRTALASRNVLLAAVLLGAGVIGARLGALRASTASADSFPVDAVADVDMVVVDAPVPSGHAVERDLPDYTGATKEDADASPDASPDSSPDAISTIYASLSAFSATVQSMIGADGDPDDLDLGSPSSPEPDPTTYGASGDPSVGEVTISLSGQIIISI